MKNVQKAFTIIELIIVLAVLGVVAAIAIPSFRTLIANERTTTLSNELVNALNIARSEALKRGTRVSVCSSSTGAACDGLTWREGWIVFTDDAATDTAGAPIINTVIKQWGAGSANAVVNASRGGVAITFMRFTGQGLLGRVGGSTDPIIINISQSGCSGNAARQLEIAVAGRVSQTIATCPGGP